MWTIIEISVLVYIIAGMVTAVVCILAKGDPAADQVAEVILFTVLGWPVVVIVGVPIYAARWIEARREASREKPHVFSEYEP